MKLVTRRPEWLLEPLLILVLVCHLSHSELANNDNTLGQENLIEKRHRSKSRDDRDTDDSGVTVTCEGGQEWTEHGFPCTATCSNTLVACRNEPPVPRCQCPSSRPVWQQGSCVLQSDCAGLCVDGESWNDCGSSCTPTCEDPTPICPRNCTPRCACPYDRPVLHEGHCITPDQCPHPEPDSDVVKH